MQYSLLLEVFSEEVPALMQQNSTIQLKKLMCEELNISSASITTFVSPRHLVAHISNFDLASALICEIRGPRINAPKQAIDGFMRKYSISNMQQLEQINGFFVLKHNPSHDEIVQKLADKLSTILQKIVWPKSMMWGNYNIRWIRPIHAILCLLNNLVIPIRFGHLIADRITYGHRSQHSPQVTIADANVERYVDALKSVGVILSAEARQEAILREISNLTSQLGLRLVDDVSLLQEVVGLVEKPHVLLGKIDEKFMRLPKEVLVTTLKYHQKYLLLQDEYGELAPYFVIVSDIVPHDDGSTIISGNEKVLCARLSDADHYIKTDLQIPLLDRTVALKKVLFHKDIGTMYEKVYRIATIAKLIAMQLSDGGKILPLDDIERASLLCKNDLVTQMVGEFPELQGIVGYYYALAQGENYGIAQAIKEHYKPCGLNDSIPSTLFSAIIAIADKLDTLNSMFEIGIQPTATKDPYALRRAALGVIRIALKYDEIMHNVSLKKIGIRDDLIAFMTERNKNMDDLTRIDDVLQFLQR